MCWCLRCTPNSACVCVRACACISRADLSRNRLSDLPPEVCLLVSLESLNVYQNCLRSLPDHMINLQALTYLNLR